LKNVDLETAKKHEFEIEQIKRRNVHCHANNTKRLENGVPEETTAEK